MKVDVDVDGRLPVPAIFHNILGCVVALGKECCSPWTCCYSCAVLVVVVLLWVVSGYPDGAAVTLWVLGGVCCCICCCLGGFDILL